MIGVPPDRPIVEPCVLACRQTENTIAFDLRIPSNLAPLVGHFPALPIVPGVCLVDWVTRLAARYGGFPDDGARQLQIKFRRILQPNSIATLTLHRVSDQRVRFDYRHLDTIYSSGTVSWGDS
jgi:3-hydroxymyristoyl/3-hydroxydecanoyl-(acyl carrier protein) dehydratase